MKCTAWLRGQLLLFWYFLMIFNGRVSCRDSPWCIFPAGKETGKSLCELCRSSPLSSRAPPSVRTSPWWSSSPPPSSPFPGFCRFSLLRKSKTQLMRFKLSFLFHMCSFTPNTWLLIFCQKKKTKPSFDVIAYRDRYKCATAVGGWCYLTLHARQIMSITCCVLLRDCISNSVAVTE